MATKKSTKRIVTPEGRLAFDWLVEPKPLTDRQKSQGREPMRSAKLILEREADMSAIKDIIVEALNLKYGSKDKWPKELKLPLKDNRKLEKTWKGFEDKFYLSASTKYEVALFGNVIDPSTRGPVSFYDRSGIPKMQPVQGFGEKGKFYSGCWVKFQISARAFEVDGSAGVTLDLHAVQFIRDDEPFTSGGVTGPAPEGFEADQLGADDASNYGNHGISAESDGSDLDI